MIAQRADYMQLIQPPSQKMGRGLRHEDLIISHMLEEDRAKSQLAS